MRAKPMSDSAMVAAIAKNMVVAIAAKRIRPRKPSTIYCQPLTQRKPAAGVAPLELSPV